METPQRLSEPLGRHGQGHLSPFIVAPTEILEQAEVPARFPSDTSGSVEVPLLDDKGQVGKTAQAFEDELIDRLALLAADRGGGAGV